MDLSFLYGAAGGGVVGVIAFIAGSLAIVYFKRLLAERDKLAENRMLNIEIKLEKHLDSDRSEVIFSELKGISGNIEKMLSQNQALLISDEAQRQQIVTLFNNQNELKNELKDCKKEHRA